MIRSEVTLSEEHFHESMRQHEELKVARKVLFAIKTICMVCLLTVAAVMFFGVKSLWGGFLILGFCVLLIFSRSADRFLLGRRLKKSPYWNRRVTIDLEEEGMRTTSELGASLTRWEAFTRAVHVKTGFLLYQGPHAFTWLPATAFAPGSNTDAMVALLKQKLKSYEERA